VIARNDNNSCEFQPSTFRGLRRRLFKKQFWKTKLCKPHANGFCEKSDEACQYAHGASELVPMPDLWKTSICKAWQTGMCTNMSSRCVFAHGVDDLRSTAVFDGKKTGGGSTTSDAVTTNPSHGEKELFVTDTAAGATYYSMPFISPLVVENPPCNADKTLADWPQWVMGTFPEPMQKPFWEPQLAHMQEPMPKPPFGNPYAGFQYQSCLKMISEGAADAGLQVCSQA
jgi:hypothetical protein